MLKEGYLAGLGVYPTWAHTEAMAEKYFAVVDRVFAYVKTAEVSEMLIEELKPCGVAHTGFKRLN